MANSQEQNIKDILDIITFVKDNAATKDDLRQFATKEDLKNFATKDDLKQMETKILSTVEDLLNPIRQELVDIKFELKEIGQSWIGWKKLRARIFPPLIRT